MIAARLRRSLSFSLGTVGAALFAAATAATLAACSAESGVTATCKPNVTETGIVASDNGCDQLAACIVDGDEADPCVCCAGVMPGDLANCMYGYGADPATCGGGSGGGGGTSDGGGGGTSSGGGGSGGS